MKPNLMIELHFIDVGILEFVNEILIYNQCDFILSGFM